jgi:hypothetical protein
LSEAIENLAYGGVYMEIKVKASIVMKYDRYDYKEAYYIKYTYKVKGFKKETNCIDLIWKSSRESVYDYDRRIIEKLSSLTVEDVIDKVKEDINKEIRYRIVTNTNEQEKERLLKSFNKIKFNFTVKDRL